MISHGSRVRTVGTLVAIAKIFENEPGIPVEMVRKIYIVTAIVRGDVEITGVTDGHRVRIDPGILDVVTPVIIPEGSP